LTRLRKEDSTTWTPTNQNEINPPADVAAAQGEKGEAEDAEAATATTVEADAPEDVDVPHLQPTVAHLPAQSTGP